MKFLKISFFLFSFVLFSQAASAQAYLCNYTAADCDVAFSLTWNNAACNQANEVVTSHVVPQGTTITVNPPVSGYRVIEFGVAYTGGGSVVDYTSHFCGGNTASATYYPAGCNGASGASVNRSESGSTTAIGAN